MPVNPNHLDSGSKEWYTPADLIHRVRLTLGGRIDLDVASCAEANETVQADHYFSENALLLEWRASTLWCNPPTGRIKWQGKTQSAQALFSQRFFDEYQAGHFDKGMLIVFAAIGSEWLWPLLQYSQGIIPRKRVQFAAPGGNKPQSPKGSMLFYVGADPRRLYRYFPAEDYYIL